MLQEVTKKNFTYNPETCQIEDNLAELLNKTTDDTFYYIGVSQFVTSYFINNPNTTWDIFAVFQIGFPFVFPIAGIVEENSNTLIKIPDNHPGIKVHEILENEIWCLFVFKKGKIQKTIIGLNNCNDSKLAFKTSSGEGISVLKEEDLGRPIYSESFNIQTGKRAIPYIDYFKAIQKTLEKGTIVERKIEFEKYREIDFEFIEIPENVLYIHYLDCLFRYKESTVNLFGYPNKDEILTYLHDEVDFIENHDDIQEGDVLFSFLSLNRSERKYEVRVSIAEKNGSKAKCEIIMRPKRLSPYYIWNYFTSEFLKDLILATYKPETVTEKTKKTLQEYKDMAGDMDELLLYKILFAMNQSHNNDDDWEDLDIHDLPIIVNLSADTEYLKKKYQWERQQKLSIQRKLEKNKHAFLYNENAKKVILRDMKELRECFNRGTYKAAIIMAGSILEAFLIDWLSEINDTNYFEEDYLIYDKYRKSYRRADLKDYISTIEDLKKPNWFDAAKKATEIRKKRNLVHAKLYINDDDISRETCTEVISYLEYVINTRWK